MNTSINYMSKGNNDCWEADSVIGEATMKNSQVSMNKSGNTLMLKYKRPNTMNRHKKKKEEPLRLNVQSTNFLISEEKISQGSAYLNMELVASD